MKIIYKSLMTIAFAGLSLASCDKELKEETAMEVGVVTDSNVSFDGKTVTVKKGNPVTFSFDGDPDFISFFSGEIGHEYKHRNRIEMQPEDVEKCEINFSVVYDYGSAKTIEGSTHILIQCIMFHTYSYSVFLYTFYVRYYHTGCPKWVFSHIFEIPAVQRATIDINSRPQ